MSLLLRLFMWRDPLALQWTTVQREKAALGDQNVTRTLELICGHLTNTLTIMLLLKFSQKANYAVNVLEFFRMSH